jgi:hypothetical protein
MGKIKLEMACWLDDCWKCLSGGNGGNNSLQDFRSAFGDAKNLLGRQRRLPGMAIACPEISLFRLMLLAQKILAIHMLHMGFFFTHQLFIMARLLPRP